MAEDSGQEKTEEPTPKKLEEAIEKGQVVNSREVTSFALLLLITIVAIWILPYSMRLFGSNLKFFIDSFIATSCLF